MHTLGLEQNEENLDTKEKRRGIIMFLAEKKRVM